MADRSADRHATPPISFRPSEAVRAWLTSKAKATGRSVNSIMLDVLEIAREAEPRMAPAVHQAAPGGLSATVIIQPTADGYEVRWYKLPAGLSPGTVNVPVSELTYLYGGAYDRYGVCVRTLDDGEQ